MLTYKESDCVVVNKHIVLRDEKSLRTRGEEPPQKNTVTAVHGNNR